MRDTDKNQQVGRVAPDGDIPPRVSVTYLTQNGGDLLRKSLEAVLSQETSFSFEIVAVDSGSSDGTLELLARNSVRFTSIPENEFNFGLTRDIAFGLARGEILVALSQDAIPRGTDWLQRLVAPFADPAVALVQGRDIPNPELELFYWDKVCLFYNTRDVKKWMRRYDNIGVSFTACALRRSVWHENPLGRVEMSEDKVFQQRIVAKGHRIIALPSIEDYHSHSYDLRQLEKRCENEGIGWRGVGIRYTAADLVLDLMNPLMWGALLFGCLTLQVRSRAELLFPVIRPWRLYRGNTSTAGYVR